MCRAPDSSRQSRIVIAVTSWYGRIDITLCERLLPDLLDLRGFFFQVRLLCFRDNRVTRIGQQARQLLSQPLLGCDP